MYELRRLLTIALVFFSAPSLSEETAQSAAMLSHAPRIVIVIDDIGNQLNAGLQAIELSDAGPISYAIIPHTPHGKQLAELAHAKNNEVLLHLPMEPLGEYKQHPGMLTNTMPRNEFIRTVRKDIESIPFISGINNHMGSLLTKNAQPMRWLMDELSLNTSLFFLDSLTSGKSVAYNAAKSAGVGALKRDVFLDSKQSKPFIERQFAMLLKIAKEQGYAIGIGHPYPETLAVLKSNLPTLSKNGYELVTLSSILSNTSTPFRYTAHAGRMTPSNLSLGESHTLNHGNLPKETTVE